MGYFLFQNLVTLPGIGVRVCEGEGDGAEDDDDDEVVEVVDGVNKSVEECGLFVISLLRESCFIFPSAKVISANVNVIFCK